MPNEILQAAQGVADALAPTLQAPAARWRWAEVESVESDGTLTVSMSGVSVSDIRAAQHVMGAKAGDRVRISRLGTEALADAVAATHAEVERDDMAYASGLASGVGSAPVRRAGAVAVLTLAGVRLASNLSSGSSVVIGTVPAGYRPAGNIYAPIMVGSNSSNYRNIFVMVTYVGDSNAGRVTLYNNSGAQLANTVVLNASTCYIIG